MVKEGEMDKVTEMYQRVENTLWERNGREVGPDGELVYPQVGEETLPPTSMMLTVRVEGTEEVIRWLRKMIAIESLRRWIGQRMEGLIATALKVATGEVMVRVSEWS